MRLKRAIPLERARSSPGRRTLVPTAAGLIASITSGETRPDLPELVLVHGVTDTADTWRSVEAPLSADTRVHSIDLPGHGLSDFPTHPPTVAEMADAVIAYLDEVGVRSAVVVGNSLGGGVALGLCSRDPSRVGAGVTLGSIGTPFPIPFPLRLLRHRPFGEAMAWVVGRPLQRLVMRDSFAPGFHPDPQDLANYFAGWRVAGRGAAVRALMRAVDVGEPQPWLGSVEVPVHVVHGELDRVIPSSVAHVLVDGLAQGRLTILDGVGHEPQHECPDRTIAIVRQSLHRG